MRLFRARSGADAPSPEHFVTAQTLAPEEHVWMQAGLQRHVDSAISKTVNLPEDISFEAFKQVYRLAYDSGCKGCTTYRPNPITGSVLSVEPVAASAGAPAGPIPAASMVEPLRRSPELAGRTHKLKWVDSPHALYITINDVEQDGRLRPFEVLMSAANMEHFAWVVALTRVITAVFRRGGDVTFVAEELKGDLRPSRRPVAGRALRAVADRGDRRHSRATYGRDRLPGGARGSEPQWDGHGRIAVREWYGHAVSAVQPAGCRERRRLHDLPQLRLVEVLLNDKAHAAPSGTMADYEAQRCTVFGGRNPSGGLAPTIFATGHDRPVELRTLCCRSTKSLLI